MAKTNRQKAIVRRRIFIISCVAVLAVAVVAVSLAIGAISRAVKGDSLDNSVSDIENPSSSEQVSGTVSSVSSDNQSTLSSNTSSSNSSSQTTSGKENNVTVGGVTLDAAYTNLMLVNGDNPLPDDYDTNVRADLVEIDKKYRNNNYVTQIHKDVYPYITAMVAAAQADGVELYVWSPFRSYAIQNDLFQKQVARSGGDEAKAATVVARPGTSEHNTGLCADFNMASDAFENTEMYRWMTENAENYGFIMRYSADKQPLTGVIHESWHWRFVGINAAKEINDLGMCLEEYVEYKAKN